MYIYAGLKVSDPDILVIFLGARVAFLLKTLT
jgi:hypothetical protein